MLQQLAPQSNVTQEVHRYLRELLVSGFQGDIATDELSLAIASTDNSIWQVSPQAVITPRTKECVQIIVSLLSLESHRSVSITPRGAGTSTAGQSLTNSIVLDCKKYMNHVLGYDPMSNQVHVECGAVLQIVNDSIREHGVMIGPTVATASRATIGGMIGNDSAGKGSCVYGKTSDCVVELETVFRDGTVWNSKSINRETLATFEQAGIVVGEIHSAVRLACDAARPHLAEHWSILPRFLTGYNLPMAWDGTTFNINRILCGSEGTLGITTSARLQCVPIPTNQQLLLLCFDSFDAALRCGNTLVQLKPTAIEVVDDMVLETVRNDTSWTQVAQFLGQVCDDVKAILFVEFSNENTQEAFLHSQASSGLLTGVILQNQTEINLVWSFRSRCVGLLSSLQGNRTPIPFVEDCAVSPKVLPDFIREFRALLDKHDLRAGMFGHVDAGVIHVRPALDMRNSVDRDKVRLVSEEVSILVRKYNGVLWGEHGKGFRSEFGVNAFGGEIWQQMCNIKAAFDPYNQFNPRKVAVPNSQVQISSTDPQKVAVPETTLPVATIDAPTRGENDERLQHLPVFSNVITCDNNSDCQSTSVMQSMCPTFRATGDPIHSPRGRVQAIRHWMSRIGSQKIGTPSSLLRRLINSGTTSSGDYSHDVRNALDGCLSCKACATDCPMQIDVSSIRSQFYHEYFGRYIRPLRDSAWINMEALLPLLATKFGRMLPTTLLASLIGIVDPPRLATPTLRWALKKRGIQTSTPIEIVQRKPSVVLLQDSFTTLYRPSVFLAMLDILEYLHITFAVLPLISCGKALYIRGALTRFKKIATRNTHWIQGIQELEIPIIGIDPAATLLWRDEYPRILSVDEAHDPPLLPQEWLVHQDLTTLHIEGQWKLFPHCIEKAIASNSAETWQQVFATIGTELHVVETACCGMGGLFGHQKEHRDLSNKIWNMHWAQHEPCATHSLTTGYSCHSQAKRCGGIALRHPLEVIANAIQSQP